MQVKLHPSLISFGSGSGSGAQMMPGRFVSQKQPHPNTNILSHNDNVQYNSGRSTTRVSKAVARCRRPSFMTVFSALEYQSL